MLPFVGLRSFEDNEDQNMDSQNNLVSYTEDSSIKIIMLIVTSRILKNFKIILPVLLVIFCYNQLIVYLIFDSFDLVIYL
jgi:hypothetical protein